MYALASCGLRRSAGVICMAGAALGGRQGVGCTGWHPVGPAALRGRRSTWSSPTGWMYGVASYGLRRSAGVICVAGAALGGFKGFDVWLGVPWSTALPA